MWLLSPPVVAFQGKLVHSLPAPVEELDATGVGAGRGGQLGCDLPAPCLDLFQILLSEASAPAQCPAASSLPGPRLCLDAEPAWVVKASG